MCSTYSKMKFFNSFFIAKWNDPMQSRNKRKIIFVSWISNENSTRIRARAVEVRANDSESKKRTVKLARQVSRISFATTIEILFHSCRWISLPANKEIILHRFGRVALDKWVIPRSRPSFPYEELREEGRPPFPRMNLRKSSSERTN